jgi:hypothetical protein
VSNMFTMEDYNRRIRELEAQLEDSQHAASTFLKRSQVLGAQVAAKDAALKQLRDCCAPIEACCDDCIAALSPTAGSDSYDAPGWVDVYSGSDADRLAAEMLSKLPPKIRKMPPGDFEARIRAEERERCAKKLEGYCPCCSTERAEVQTALAKCRVCGALCEATLAHDPETHEVKVTLAVVGWTQDDNGYRCMKCSAPF